MATATGNYVHDNSSFANFAAWATAIDAAFLTLAAVAGSALILFGLAMPETKLTQNITIQHLLIPVEHPMIIS